MRCRLLPPLVVPLIGCVLFLPPAHGEGPDPLGSYVAPCLVACPAGDSNFVVITRQFDGSPWMHGQVTVDFCACAGFRLVTNRSRSYVVMPSGCAIARDPDALGVSFFPIAGGGTCTQGEARVYADGIPFGSRAIASPDQDGDWVVTEADVALLAGKLGRSDSKGDFDCDGVVSITDIAIVRSHLGHMGDLLTSLRASSWGGLKIAYR